MLNKELIIHAHAPILLPISYQAKDLLGNFQPGGAKAQRFKENRPLFEPLRLCASALEIPLFLIRTAYGGHGRKCDNLNSSNYLSISVR